MKSKKILSALVLSGVMLIGSSMPVFAQTADDTGIVQNGTENSPVELDITKDLQFAEGIQIPNMQFDFTVIPVTEGAPDAKIASVNYSPTDNKGAITDGKYTVSKTARLTFEKEFPHAGVFEYTVNETDGKVDGVTYDTNSYKIDVHVANKNAMDGKTYVKAIISKANQTNEKKPIKFVNTYAKDTTLIIEKKVSGELGDLTKQFDFRLTLKKPATSTLNTFSATITRNQGVPEQIEVKNGEEYTFKLAHGDTLKFDKLPNGTTYTVTEVGANDGYTPKVTVVENDVKTADNKQVNESADVSSMTGEKENLVGEGENKVTFVNEYKEISVTGIITNNRPFILLIGLGVCGFASLTILKRRKSTR